MKRPGTLAVVMATTLGLLACSTSGLTPLPSSNIPSGTLSLSPSTNQPAAAFQVLRSEKERITSPVVSPSDLQALVDGNTAFAFDLYHQLKQEDGNIFFSPYSISLAAGMTYAGARGETEKQMSEILNFTLPQASLHPAFNALALELAKRGKDAEGKDTGFRLNVANATWGQEGFGFQEGFLDTLAESYGAGMRVVDFIDETEESRLTINDWVEKETEDKIKDLLPKGVINPDTRLVLTNAIYFKAKWANRFDTSRIDKGWTPEKGKFILLDGTELDVPIMSCIADFVHVAGDGYQAIELPYVGRELSMVIVMPDSGSFQEIENGLSKDKLGDIVRGLEKEDEYIMLTMPKFKFDSDFSLKDSLSVMGMENAFNPGSADLSGMTGKRDLAVSDVVHKTFVAVDEFGTEAAAASGALVHFQSAPTPVKIDRPFIFLIRDVKTGTVLFLGRVLNPGS